MYQLVLFLLFHLFVFLFCLYVLSNDDTVLIRKNMTLEHTFNVAFFVVFAGLFFARLFYVFFHFSASFLNPLVFLLFPYFPGLSLAGGVIGASLFLFVYSKRKKLPAFRLFDFFAFSFFCALSLGFLNIFLLGKKPFFSFEFFLISLHIGLFVIFALILLPMQQRKALKEGNLGLVVLIVFSVITFSVHVVQRNPKAMWVISGEEYLLILLFFVSVVLLTAKERIQLMLKNR